MAFPAPGKAKSKRDYRMATNPFAPRADREQRRRYVEMRFRHRGFLGPDSGGPPLCRRCRQRGQERAHDEAKQAERRPSYEVKREQHLQERRRRQKRTITESEEEVKETEAELEKMVQQKREMHRHERGMRERKTLSESEEDNEQLASLHKAVDEGAKHSKKQRAKKRLKGRRTTSDSEESKEFWKEQGKKSSGEE